MKSQVWSGRESLSTSTSFLLSFPILLLQSYQQHKRSLYFPQLALPLNFPDSLIIEKQSLPDPQDSRFNISASRCVSDSFQFLIAGSVYSLMKESGPSPLWETCFPDVWGAIPAGSLAVFVVPTPVQRFVSREGRASDQANTSPSP